MTEAAHRPQQHVWKRRIMGCQFEFVVVHHHTEFAEQQLQKAVDEAERIEALLSEFIDTSDTGRIISNAANNWVAVSAETYALLQRCHDLSVLTKGYFDVSMAALKPLYRFKNENRQLPSQQQIREKLPYVNFKNIRLHRHKHAVRFKKQEMRISFAAIGKGYASDRIKQIWKDGQLHNACINASGDMQVLGTNAEGQPWQVAIADPEQPQRALLHLPLTDFAIATSGDYEQHFIYKGKRYSHTINPKTGLAVSGLQSVSVFSLSAELSDALATAAHSMGLKKGLAFINQLPQTHAIFVNDDNKIHMTKNLRLQRSSNLLCGLIFCLLFMTLSACATALKPYERIYVDDPEMQMQSSAHQQQQDYVHAIREGSTPSSSSTGSGGCGCK